MPRYHSALTWRMGFCPDVRNGVSRGGVRDGQLHAQRDGAPFDEARAASRWRRVAPGDGAHGVRSRDVSGVQTRPRLFRALGPA